MKEMDYLESIEKMLTQESFDCSLIPDNKAPPFGKLLVFLGHDSLERERILEMTVQHQELGESLRDPPAPPQYLRIQFEVLFPFEIKELTTNEIASLLPFLNRMLELPGFELDEINSKIYYRYVLLTAAQELEKNLLTGIIGVIILFFKIFSDTIEQVAEGKKTFNDFLEQILEFSETLSSHSTQKA